MRPSLLRRIPWEECFSRTLDPGSYTNSSRTERRCFPSRTLASVTLQELPRIVAGASSLPVGGAGTEMFFFFFVKFFFLFLFCLRAPHTAPLRSVFVTK